MCRRNSFIVNLWSYFQLLLLIWLILEHVALCFLFHLMGAQWSGQSFSCNFDCTLNKKKQLAIKYSLMRIRRFVQESVDFWYTTIFVGRSEKENSIVFTKIRCLVVRMRLFLIYHKFCWTEKCCQNFLFNSTKLLIQLNKKLTTTFPLYSVCLWCW